jgi:hypothetical protein
MVSLDKKDYGISNQVIEDDVPEIYPNPYSNPAYKCTSLPQSNDVPIPSPKNVYYKRIINSNNIPEGKTIVEFTHTTYDALSNIIDVGSDNFPVISNPDPNYIYRCCEDKYGKTYYYDQVNTTWIQYNENKINEQIKNKPLKQIPNLIERISVGKYRINLSKYIEFESVKFVRKLLCFPLFKNVNIHRVILTDYVNPVRYNDGIIRYYKKKKYFKYKVSNLIKALNNDLQKYNVDMYNAKVITQLGHVIEDRCDIDDKKLLICNILKSKINKIINTKGISSNLTNALYNSDEHYYKCGYISIIGANIEFTVNDKYYGSDNRIDIEEQEYIDKINKLVFDIITLPERLLFWKDIDSIMRKEFICSISGYSSNHKKEYSIIPPDVFYYYIQALLKL